MTMMFYICGVVAVIATVMAITRRNPVHAVIYLVHSFFALALIFYLLGAPLLAAWELIIYAGAIMVLFLFIIMMLQLSPGSAGIRLDAACVKCMPVILLALALAGATLLLTILDPLTGQSLPRWHATPRQFGYTLFKEYALAVEIASFQLLFAAVGAFYIGRDGGRAELAGGRE